MTRITSYSYKHVDMLLTSSVIVNSLKNNLAELSVVRSDWTPEYVDALSSRIEEAMSNLLGKDYRSDLREATGKLMEIMETAMKDLSFFKVQVENDFSKEEAGEILNKLGFTRYYAGVQRHDQESLMNLLFAFSKGMSDDLKSLIAGNGTNPQLIDRILGYTSEFQQANILQERLKEEWNLPSKEARQEFQAIYEEVIKICKIASAYYRSDPIRKNLFSFSRVVRNVNFNRSRQEEEPTA